MAAPQFMIYVLNYHIMYASGEKLTASQELICLRVKVSQKVVSDERNCMVK